MYIDAKGLDTICGNDGVWIPDPDNPGHGKCKKTRDHGPQCPTGSCVAFPPMHNDSCVQACIDRKSSGCIGLNAPKTLACIAAVTASCSSETCDKNKCDN